MHTPTRNEPPVRRPHSLGDALLERYSLDRETARTEAGVIYDATDKATMRLVSIEIANDLSDDARLGFERDAMISQRLEGEHVLRVLEVGVLNDGTPFVVREPALGSLANDVSARGPLPTSEAVAWTLEVCEALAEAHSRGIAHGDIRAETVFLGRDHAGNPIAKVRWTSKAKAEKTAREDVAGDIRGAALLLRFLITGQPDAEDDSAKTLPTDIGFAVARATAKNEDMRFRNIGELASVLARYAPPDHQSARNISFLLSRAGIVGAPVSIPVSQRTTTPNPIVAPPPIPSTPMRPSLSSGVQAISAPPPSSRRVPISGRQSQPGLNEEWFAPRPARISDVPLAPPRRHSSGPFAAVALLLLGATIGGTLWLYSTGRLPQWSGTAPPTDEGKMEPIDRTELVNTLAENTTLMTTPRLLEGPGLVEWERWTPPVTDVDDLEGRMPAQSPTSPGITQAPMDTKPAMPSLGSDTTPPSSTSKAKTAPTTSDPSMPRAAEPWPGTAQPPTTASPPSPSSTTNDTTPMAPTPTPTTTPTQTPTPSPRLDDPGF